MLEIIDYEERYANDFRELNLEWLEKFHLTEEHDLRILNNPKQAVIDGGGCIFLAKENDAIIGTAGLMHHHDTTYELVKMAVAPACRGKGISKILLDKCLEKARRLGASKIMLYSNSQLTAAIALYKKYGFQHVDASDSPLETADVKMELILD